MKNRELTTLHNETLGMEVISTEQFYQNVIHYINVWGYIAILVDILLESANIPIPSKLMS